MACGMAANGRQNFDSDLKSEMIWKNETTFVSARLA